MHYDHYSTGLEGDVQFYIEEAQKAGAPVLEFGCGTGRILIPIKVLFFPFNRRESRGDAENAEIASFAHSILIRICKKSQSSLFHNFSLRHLSVLCVSAVLIFAKV